MTGHTPWAKIHEARPPRARENRPRYRWDDDLTPVEVKQPEPTHTWAGERIPPVMKPFRKKHCVWVDGIGWVLNPSGRRFVA